MFGAKMLNFVCMLFASIFLFGTGVSALGSQPVISHLKTGETGFASQEFIAIYNNSLEAVDVSGWCLAYSSSSDVTQSTLSCLDSEDEDVALMLSPFSFARFSTSEFKNDASGFIPDGEFSSGLSGTSGHVRLLNKDKTEIDKIGWGSAVNPETKATPAHESGYFLERIKIVGTDFLQDTNKNNDDFSPVLLEIIPSSGIYETEIETDVCPNIGNVQAAVPDDYFLDERGDCVQDQCDNLEGLQATVPNGYVSSDGENCEEDLLDLESSILQITELLPNASSVDTGKEFVEVYNPNSTAVELEGYKLELGPVYSKSYALKKQLLNPDSFMQFSDIITGLTLPNSSASVRLVAPAGNTVSETDIYENPKDDQAWALINEVWQYTNNPTPGLPNLPSINEADNSSKTDGLADCGPGRYRHPETNRCRNIIAGDVELKPCEAGQARNPETNRCRSSASDDSLVPCKTGQERNPETNRCRNIVSTASALKPCEPGQERNPETNRCRKIAALGASTLADVQDVPAESNTITNWWVIGGVLAVASGYGIYEWRREVMRGISK